LFVFFLFASDFAMLSWRMLDPIRGRLPITMKSRNSSLTP
jgi:hypothetical protein